VEYFQVPIADLPLLQRVADFLVGLPVAAAEARVETVGDWVHELAAGPPQGDLDLPTACRSAHVVEAHIDLNRVLDHKYEVRAVHYYPRGGGMGWHTNSLRPGWRLYVPRLLDPNPASGIVLEDRRIPDRPGYANLFRVGHGAWHAVVAHTARFSAGIRLPDDAPEIDQLLNRTPSLVEC
jgi:hypothetical protein